MCISTSDSGVLRVTFTKRASPQKGNFKANVLQTNNVVGRGLGKNNHVLANTTPLPAYKQCTIPRP